MKMHLDRSAMLLSVAREEPLRLERIHHILTGAQTAVGGILYQAIPAIPKMDDSELFNLTVVELRSLCNEKGLEAAKLRKKQIVELLVDNGVSEIPENLKNRSTPRKSVMTTRRSALTPQMNPVDANPTVQRGSTPRQQRYHQRYTQLHRMKTKEPENANKENEGEQVENESSVAVTEKSAKTAEDVSPRDKDEVFADAKESLSDAATESSETDYKDEAQSSGGSGDAAEDKEDSTTKLESSEKEASKGSDDAEKESEDAVSASSFTTAASPGDGRTSIDRDDNDGAATPKKSRKRWSASIVEEFDFARESEPPAALSTKTHEGSGSPTSPSAMEENDSEQSPDTVNKDSPERPKLARQQTYTVVTPASKSTPGVSTASKVSFKASKTPNFKKIHERNQAKMENISEFSARKRDRMRQLLSTTREIRTAGTASREAAQTPKTPLRTVKAISHIETPASERKILSNKVRSNRRFELLMKARGLPVDGEVPEDH